MDHGRRIYRSGSSDPAVCAKPTTLNEFGCSWCAATGLPGAIADVHPALRKWPACPLGPRARSH
jgi:hypothetical protein